MTRRRMTPLRRARIFDTHGGVCHLCGLKIQIGEAWDVEHIVALALSDDDSDDNLAPAHVACHRPKTSEDVARIAKAKRVRAKHIGAKAPRSTLAGSKASRFKKTLDGRVIDRATGKPVGGA
jgi:5-methylcytosine-specific restriction endonuclease McrA